MITALLGRAQRFLLYALFLLMPSFFVPWATLPVDFNKQLFLAVIVFAAGILWAIDTLRKGEVSFRWHILFVPLGIFVLVAFISTLGSGAFLHSFWGANAEPDSFFNILLFALLFVLIANKLAKREYAQKAIGFFVAGAVLSTLLLFAHSLFSFTFSFGSPYAFAIYAGGAFLIAIFFAAHTSKGTYGSYLTYAAAIILFLVLVFVSQWIAWAGVAVGALLIIYFLLRNQEATRSRLMLPLVILGLSLTFWFVGNPLSSVLSIAPEVRLGRGATIDIAKSTVSSSVKNALFGSGPTTFRNQYHLYRSPDVNSSPFWNVSFPNGSGAIMSFFATLGVLGGGAIMVFWLWFLWFCIKFLLRLGKQENPVVYSVILIGGIYFFISWFFYAANFTLLFAGFSFVALWVGLRGKQKKISFSQSPASMFRGMAGSVAVLAVFVFGGYTVLRNYSAEAAYARGLNLANQERYEQAIVEFQKAARINGFDTYWRKLSEAFLSQTIAIFNNPDISADKKNPSVQRGILVAEEAAKEAIRANSKNSTNFEFLGDVYTKLAPITDDQSTVLPFPYYSQAASLIPTSPFIPLKKARAYLVIAKRFERNTNDLRNEAASLEAAGSEGGGPQILELKKRLSATQQARAAAVKRAREEAENALALKRDFKDALDFLASLPLATDSR